MFDYILDFSAPRPPAHKISNNILIYLLLTGYCNCPPPPLSVIKIVKYCDVWGGGAKILQKNNGAPLSVIKIVKYCGVVGGGGALVALKSYKHNGAPSLSLRIVASGGAPKSYKNNGAPSLCH